MHDLLIAAVGFLAGSMNAVAGGGSFVTLPALVFSGLPALVANATSTVALFPGNFASALAYREDFRRAGNLSVRQLLPASVVGGLTGAVLLLTTPVATFDHVLPWLFLTGTLAFAFGRQAGSWLRRRLRIGPRALVVAQLLLGVYAGYFGGAVGLMMMAVWTLFGIDDLVVMNATKALLVGAANTVAVVCFVAAGVVWWRPALVMGVAAIAGGYAAARVGRRIDPARLRLGISILNAGITVFFFVRHHG